MNQQDQAPKADLNQIEDPGAVEPVERGQDHVQHPPRRQRADAEVDAIDAKTQAKLNNIEMRKEFANKAFSLASYGVYFWIVVVILDLVILGTTHQHALSDTALATITAGATVNVLAAFLGVIRGLFPGRRPESSDKGKIDSDLRR